MRVATLGLVLVSAFALPAAAQSPAAPFLDGRVNALAIGRDGSVYAGGNVLRANTTVAHIARWDGTAWSALGTGIGGAGVTYVFALAVGPDGSLYAAGRFTMAGGSPASNVARWDGTSWSPLGTGIGADGSFAAVYALAIGPDGSLYAGGNFTQAGSVSTGGLARWDGTAWTVVGGNSEAGAEALAFAPDGALYVAGYFSVIGGVPAYRIARWDGAAWSALSTGLRDGVPLALAVSPDGSTVYAGGKFIYAGGVHVERVARWDGASWRALGAGSGLPPGPFGVSREAWALAVRADGSVYVGGQFGVAGPLVTGGIALWSKSAGWSRLGGGLGGSAYALALAPDGTLYVGGSFRTAGGQPATNVARWDGQAWSSLGEATVPVASELGPAVASALRVAVAPNPSRGAATLTLTGASGEAVVEVLDALGRRVARVVSAESSREIALPAGLVPGVYVVRVTAGGETAVRPFVVVR